MDDRYIPKENVYLVLEVLVWSIFDTLSKSEAMNGVAPKISVDFQDGSRVIRKMTIENIFLEEVSQ